MLGNPSQARSGSTNNQQNHELEVGFGVHAMAPKVAMQTRAAFKRRGELTQHGSVKSRNKSLPGRGAYQHHWQLPHRASSIPPLHAPRPSYPGIFDYNQSFWYSPLMPSYEFQYPNWALPERTYYE